jgi:1,2-diacylglycerol 3-alpha-glucosyltransferase
VNIGIVTTWFERGAAYVSRQYAKSFLSKHDVLIYARGGDQKWDNDFNCTNVTWAKTKGMPVSSAFCLDDYSRWPQVEK